MAKSKGKKKVEENGQEVIDQEKDLKEEDVPTNEEGDQEEQKSEVELLKEEVEGHKDKYLRLYSEFDNFRRRTAKERLELIKTANEELVTSLLPVIDDFERAMKAMDSQEKSEEKEGMELIYSKMVKVLEQKGVKVMEIKVGDDFNDDVHEAITQIPAPSDDLKGKIVDVIEPGYYLDEKVVRFARVVTGS